jgi:hypothetical protein
VVDPDNDLQARVKPALLGPEAGEVWEAGDVERRHDPAVIGGKFKTGLVEL